MDFEWDENKAANNIRKHDVTFQEAATVFGDPLAIAFSDPDHSIGEHRLLTFDRAATDKLVSVSHIISGDYSDHKRSANDQARENVI